MPKNQLRIEGGEYAPVASRIALFHEQHSEGRIITELVSQNEREVVFKALVYRSSKDALPAATGWASERFGDGEINQVACLENTETSAIGRALANLGFLASRNRPSIEEMQKAERARGRSRYHGTTTPARAARVEERAVDLRLQARADMANDVIRLLESAARLGARRSRVHSLQQRVLASTGDHSDLERLERRVRRWLEDRR